MILYDPRGNEFKGATDTVGAETLTESRTLTASLNANNAEVVTPLNGHATVIWDIRGTFTLTVSFEASIDGTNYFAIPVMNQATELYTMTIAGAGATVATVVAECSGFKQVRARVSAYTSGPAVVAARASYADSCVYAKVIPATLTVTTTAAAGSGATLTLPAVTGMYHYITAIEISRNATAVLVGTATLVISTTNLPSLSWSVGNAMLAGGTQLDVQAYHANPIKSVTVGSATTIVAPAPGAAVLWRLNAYYYVGY